MRAVFPPGGIVGTFLFTILNRREIMQYDDLDPFLLRFREALQALESALNTLLGPPEPVLRVYRPKDAEPRERVVPELQDIE